MPSLTDTTYKLEAEIIECEPPRCNVIGRIKTMDDKLVAEVRRDLTTLALHVQRVRSLGAYTC